MPVPFVESTTITGTAVANITTARMNITKPIVHVNITTMCIIMEKAAAAGMVITMEKDITTQTRCFVAGDEGWFHFDYTPGEADIRVGTPAVTGRLCVIGSGLQEAALEKLFD